MGLAMLVFAPMAVFTTRERIRLCAVLGLVVACLAPAMTAIDSDNIPWLVRSWFLPNLNYFGFFPWGAFLAFGMAAGSAIRIIKHEDMSRAMLWMLGIGLGLVSVARYLAELPYSIYTKSDFWLNSPALTLIKLGCVLALLAIAFLWVNAGVELQNWSLFRQLGTTSLLVYWVHIELVYGRWLGFWKENLNVGQVLLLTVAILVLMTGLSLLRTRWPDISLFFKAAFEPEPRRASGD